ESAGSRSLLGKCPMPSLSAAQQRHAEYYQKLLERAQGLFLTGGVSTQEGLTLFDTDKPNIDIGQSWAAQNAQTNLPAQVLCSLYPLSADILRMRQHPTQRIAWIQKGIEASEAITDFGRAASHHANLAIALGEQGKYSQAVEIYENAISYFRATGQLQN